MRAPFEYRAAMEKINAVTAEEVTRAARSYLRDRPKCWAVSAHPEVIERLRLQPGGYAPEVRTARLPGA